MITIKDLLSRLKLVRDKNDNKPPRHKLQELIAGMTDTNKHPEIEFKTTGKEEL
jgi:hypothetical protein